MGMNPLRLEVSHEMANLMLDVCKTRTGTSNIAPEHESPHSQLHYGHVELPFIAVSTVNHELRTFSIFLGSVRIQPRQQIPSSPIELNTRRWASMTLFSIYFQSRLHLGV